MYKATLYKVIGGVLNTREVNNPEEHDAALADGWCVSEDAAKQGYIDQVYKDASLLEDGINESA